MRLARAWRQTLRTTLWGDASCCMRLCTWVLFTLPGGGGMRVAPAQGSWVAGGDGCASEDARGGARRDRGSKALRF